MSFSFLLMLLAGVGYFWGTIYFSNRVQATGERPEVVRALWYSGLVLMIFLGLSVMLFGFGASDFEEVQDLPGGESAETAPDALDPDQTGEIPLPTGAETAFTLLVISFTIVTTTVFINSDGVRRAFGQFLDNEGDFDASSIVHITAVILALVMLALQIGLFLLGGGSAGLTEAYSGGGVSVSLLALQMAIQVGAAVLGVGYLTRRDGQQVLARLGLRLPKQEDLSYGVGVGLGLYGVAIVFGLILTIFIPQDQLEAQGQAAESLARAFATLPLALALATAAAVGEEILFRGALQPVFGNVLTSIFFALLHTQSLLSPGIFLLFAVSLGLGWVRTRYSTTAAIIAHFVYNFVQLLILMSVMSSGAT